MLCQHSHGGNLVCWSAEGRQEPRVRSENLNCWAMFRRLRRSHTEHIAVPRQVPERLVVPCRGRSTSRFRSPSGLVFDFILGGESLSSSDGARIDVSDPADDLEHIHARLPGLELDAACAQGRLPERARVKGLVLTHLLALAGAAPCRHLCEPGAHLGPIDQDVHVRLSGVPSAT
ncbi:hypothetical protein VTO42DRAFT_7215 [Malbranchea cinnamomea]